MRTLVESEIMQVNGGFLVEAAGILYIGLLTGIGFVVLFDGGLMFVPMAVGACTLVALMLALYVSIT